MFPTFCYHQNWCNALSYACIVVCTWKLSLIHTYTHTLLHLGGKSCHIGHAHLCNFNFSWHYQITLQSACTNLYTHQQNFPICLPAIVIVRLLKYFPDTYKVVLFVIISQLLVRLTIFLYLDWPVCFSLLEIPFLYLLSFVFNWKAYLFLVHS